MAYRPQAGMNERILKDLVQLYDYPGRFRAECLPREVLESMYHQCEQAMSGKSPTRKQFYEEVLGDKTFYGVS